MGLNYKITKIEHGIARVSYGDGSWADLRLRAGMTPEEVDDLAYRFGPQPAAAPQFLKPGQRRVAQPIPAPVEEPFDGAAHVAKLDPDLHARIARNRRLAATDHFALTDRSLPDAVATYRQALRDLPATKAWVPRLAWDETKGVVVLGVAWPEMPKEVPKAAAGSRP